MGDPKLPRKHYETPSHPWDGTRISEENQIIKKYGLKNKRELWKVQTLLKDLRSQARELQARIRSEDDQAIVERDGLIARLQSLGLLSKKADLNDVLALEVEALLARRLQTQCYLKGLARTVKQARQLIVHGHISVDGRKMTVPGYLVPDMETGLITYYHSSPFTHELHPEKPEADFTPRMTTVKEERRVSAEKERDMRRARELERIEAMRAKIKKDLEDDEDIDEDEDVDLDEEDLTDENGEDKAGDGPEKPPEGKGKDKDAPKEAEKKDDKAGGEKDAPEGSDKEGGEG